MKMTKLPISVRWRFRSTRTQRADCRPGRTRSFGAIQPKSLSLLKDLSAGLSTQIGYQSRETEGTQTPTQTFDRGLGSCRDLAVLFADAARMQHPKATHCGDSFLERVTSAAAQSCSRPGRVRAASDGNHNSPDLVMMGR
jgi:hypothetical protein